ncbi:MAG: hypothetical protein U5L01_17610 [Rheinheimera sp.]|nr:hypothetical protein [Rheinheimera sp.]
MFQRKTKRNETQGIPVGPATSSIVSEIILGRIDTELAAKGYEYWQVYRRLYLLIVYRTLMPMSLLKT